MTDTNAFYALRDELRALRDVIPALRSEVAGGPNGESPGEPAGGVHLPWRDRLVRSVLPAIDLPLPVLLVAISGGGSTGKSTLFNVLAGKELSRVGFRAGLTSRVLLAGHPDVLSGPDVAASLLHRLAQAPEPWSQAGDAVTPGPPLYAASSSVPPNLLLIDTPDFDTGVEGRMVNRERAEPVLRTAEVIVYVFTNTVYNNLSNTRFMADIVGAIGGRPMVLVYRVSRAADDAEVLEHCRVVARHLYRTPQGRELPRRELPSEILGIYRMHESDAVALGQAEPSIIPVGDVTGGRAIRELLSGLDVARIKRRVFAADLEQIRREAAADLEALRGAAHRASLYRRGLEQVTAQEALGALRTFPMNEAVALTTRLFLESSPAHIKVLRATGRVVAAPLRGVQALGRALERLVGEAPDEPAPPDPTVELERDLLNAANALRNRLLDDHLIVRVTADDPLLREARAEAAEEGGAAQVEPLGGGVFNVHLTAPAAVRAREADLLARDWTAVTRDLRAVAHDLVGLPADIEEDLAAIVTRFRAGMGWRERVREGLFASLSALPSLLGVTYMLLTANPVAGAGIWIELQGLFGLNDLWALVSIPASAGLSEQERKQLQQMVAPAFRLWFERRLTSVVSVLQDAVCRPALEALDGVPAPDDARFARVERALASLEVPT